MTYTIADLAYCTNVHAGENIEEINANLDRFVGSVRQQLAAKQLSAGLWISDKASRSLSKEDVRLHLQQHLSKNQLSLQSINGFPFYNFHKEVVKASVYLPDWSCHSRLQYTRSLAEILAQCLDEDKQKGTISTLPLGFRKSWTQEKQITSLNNLLKLVTALSLIEEQTGKCIQVCLEMEPACVLEKTEQMISFFTSDLEQAAKDNNISIDNVYRYLGVCYDVCHQAVMFEESNKSLSMLIKNGIEVGKIQLSSALLLDSDCLENSREQLKPFAEPRYLHQTSIHYKNGQRAFYEDLDQALKTEKRGGHQQWRVHYHVPLQLNAINEKGLSTTRFATDEVFAFLAANRAVKPHLEVETYTWSVLPASIRPGDDESMVAGIDAELQYVKGKLKEHRLLRE